MDNVITEFASRRSTGCTSQMVTNIAKDMIGNSGKRYVVLAISHDLAQEIMAMVFSKLPVSSIGCGDASMEWNENIIVFRGVDWKETPSFKYQEWDRVWEDNSIGLAHAEKMRKALL